MALLLIGLMLFVPACDRVVPHQVFGSFNGEFWDDKIPQHDTSFSAANIDEFFREFFEKYLEHSPLSGTWLGDLGDDVSVERRDHLLDNFSYGHEQWFYRFVESATEKLQSFPAESLNANQRLNKEILLWTLDRWLEGEQYMYHGYLTNHFNGIHVQLPSFLMQFHQINDYNSAENYIKRLQAFDTAVLQVITGIRTQVEKGILVPKVSYERTLENLEAFVSTKVEENELYTVFAAQVDMLDLPPAQGEDLKERARQAIAHTVYPAFKQLGAYLSENKVYSNATGVSSLPGGKDYYAYLVRYHTTTDLSPDEVFALGERIVEETFQEIIDVIVAMGERPENIGQIFGHIYSEGTITGREETLAHYREMVEQAWAKLPQLFELIPSSPVVVEPVPEFRAKNSSSYYSGPSRDGRRPGTFFLNLSHEHNLYTSSTLAFHEGVPGHHLQISLEKELPGIPLFRDVTNFTAYVEGWATYAEGLFFEEGLINDPYSHLGYLQYKLIGGVLLVADVGMHWKGWTQRQTQNYMIETIGGNIDLDRYMVYPGQVLSYQVGAEFIKDLRRQAQAQLGPKFDIRQFHTVILQNGSMPLSLLEEQVQQWIEAKIAE